EGIKAVLVSATGASSTTVAAAFVMAGSGAGVDAGASNKVSISRGSPQSWAGFTETIPGDGPTSDFLGRFSAAAFFGAGYVRAERTAFNNCHLGIGLSRNSVAPHPDTASFWYFSPL